MQGITDEEFISGELYSMNLKMKELERSNIMGYKAQVKELETKLDIKDSQIETLFAMLKKVVMQCGEKHEDVWSLTVPYFEPSEINGTYSVETGIREDNSFIMVVKEEKEDAAGEA